MKLERYIYEVNGTATAVNIDASVIDAGYRYAEIEYAVTGSNHVQVNAPEHYKGYINEEVYVTIDDNGDIVIKEVKIRRSKNQEMLAQVLEGKTWVQAPQMPALPAEHTSADVVIAGITEYIVAEGLTAMKYSVNDDIRQIIIVYTEHSVVVFRVDSAGAVKLGTLRNKDLAIGRHKINLVHGCIHVNELIVRINNIANGVIDAYGQEYNHHTPVSMAPETFGPDAGSMATKSHNRGDHKNLCERIHNEVGIIPHVKSYYSSPNNVYGLLGLNRQITPADLVQFNPRVVDGIYYFN
jgi:hypothetical protein